MKYLWAQFTMWTNKKVLSFIKDLQLNECLWNMKNEQYRDRKAKSDAIEHLSSKYEISVREVEKKIANLKCQFRREHKKSSNLNKSGSYPRATWFGYKPLLFLLQHVEKDKVQEDELSSNLDSFSVKTVYRENPGMSTALQKSRFPFPKPKINCVKNNIGNERETIKCIKTESSTERDEFLVYGEHIASKLQNSGRSRKEIGVAQNLIDRVCFNLIMGAYFEDSNRYSVPQLRQSSTLMPLLP